MFFKQLTQSPHLQTRKTYPQFESIWDLHVLEIFVSLFWKSSDSSSCDLGFSIDHHIHQLGVAVQSEWVHKRKKLGECALHIIRNSFPMRFVYDFTIIKEFIQLFLGILVMRRLFLAVKGHLGREIWLSFIFMSYIKRDLHVFCTECMSWRNKCTF